MKNTNINKVFGSVLSERKKSIRLSDDQIENITQISGAVLAVIATAGILLLSAAAPNVIGAIGSVAKSIKGRKFWTKEEKKAKIRRAFYYLKNSGMVKLTGEASNIKVAVTAKGLEKLKRINFFSKSVPRLKTWDKKWWLVAADIPSKEYRWAADLFRRKIKQMGFYTLQRTLWFYPFNPQVEIQFIAEWFGIEKYITVMEVSRLDVEDQKSLIEHFKLKKIL